MSRSRKKTPITSMCICDSAKQFKRKENRRERRAVKVALRCGKEILPHRKQYGNEWASPRDGKRWVGPSKNPHNSFLYRLYASMADFFDLSGKLLEIKEDYKRLMRK